MNPEGNTTALSNGNNLHNFNELFVLGALTPLFRKDTNNNWLSQPILHFSLVFLNIYEQIRIMSSINNIGIKTWFKGRNQKYWYLIFPVIFFIIIGWVSYEYIQEPDWVVLVAGLPVPVIGILASSIGIIKEFRKKY